jgi:hypothetical protein
MTAPKGWKVAPEIPTDEMADAALPHDDTFGRGFKQRIYREMLAAAPQAPLAVVPLVDEIYEALGDKAQLRTSRENVVDTLHALISTELRAAPHDGKLTVWYGAMPESNGRHNYTAILHRGNVSSGITIDRSEYPERTRYEADRMRWMIGELAEAPFVLDYDADKHSGYKPSIENEQAKFNAWFNRLPEDEEGFKVLNGFRANSGFLWAGWKAARGLE